MNDQRLINALLDIAYRHAGSDDEVSIRRALSTIDAQEKRIAELELALRCARDTARNAMTARNEADEKADRMSAQSRALREALAGTIGVVEAAIVNAAKPGEMRCIIARLQNKLSVARSALETTND